MDLQFSILPVIGQNSYCLSTVGVSKVLVFTKLLFLEMLMTLSYKLFYEQTLNTKARSRLRSFDTEDQRHKNVSFVHCSILGILGSILRRKRVVNLTIMYSCCLWIFIKHMIAL